MHSSETVLLFLLFLDANAVLLYASSIVSEHETFSTEAFFLYPKRLKSLNHILYLIADKSFTSASEEAD